MVIYKLELFSHWVHVLCEAGIEDTGYLSNQSCVVLVWWAVLLISSPVVPPRLLQQQNFFFIENDAKFDLKCQFELEIEFESFLEMQCTIVVSISRMVTFKEI